MKVSKERLPLFEHFIGVDVPTEESNCSQLTQSNKIHSEGIEINLNTNANDIKNNIHELKKQIVQLEKTMEKLISFERNEAPAFASKVKKVLSTLNEQGLDYSYDVSINAYCEIKGIVNIKADGAIDESIGEIITEAFSEKPILDYYEMPSDDSIFIAVKWK